MSLVQREHPEILAGVGRVSKKWISAYKSSNISEKQEDRTKVILLRTNRKSPTRSQLVPKSTTLDNFKGHYFVFDVGITACLQKCLGFRP